MYVSPVITRKIESPTLTCMQAPHKHTNAFQKLKFGKIQIELKTQRTHTHTCSIDS